MFFRMILDLLVHQLLQQMYPLLQHQPREHSLYYLTVHLREYEQTLSTVNSKTFNVFGISMFQKYDTAYANTVLTGSIQYQKL